MSQLEVVVTGISGLVEARDSAAQPTVHRKLSAKTSPSPRIIVPRSAWWTSCEEWGSHLRYQQCPFPALSQWASYSSSLVVSVLICETGIIPVFRVKVPFGGVFLCSVSKVPAIENVP